LLVVRHHEMVSHHKQTCGSTGRQGWMDLLRPVMTATGCMDLLRPVAVMTGGRQRTQNPASEADTTP